MSKYQLSELARRDIQQIWKYISKNNRTAADRLIARLYTAMEKLAQVPGMGHTRRDVKNPRYLFWPVHSYIIAYVPDAKPLRIMRVLHGARDISRMFTK